MTQDLILVHRQSEKDLTSSLPQALVWKTCLRQIAIVQPGIFAISVFEPTDQIMKDAEAYQFLLEVISGLHSPLIGETEVQGQFKQFILNAELGQDAWATFIKKLFYNLLTDAKDVRTKYLRDLGSQSYGSLVRKNTKNIKSLSMIGAGQLAQEVLPWVMKMETVEVYCRNVEKASELKKNFPMVEVKALAAKATVNSRPAALVIAAPLKALEIQKWLEKNQQNYDVIIDLRGESKTDALQVANVLALGDLFQELESQRLLIANKTKAAREEIAQLSQSYGRRAEHRPFGWDDLCA